MVWKAEGVPGRHPAQILARQLRDDGLLLEGRTTTLVAADQRWEQGVVEGPALVQRAGRWVLLYSGGDWRGAGYGIGAASCHGPLGPCDKVQDGPIYSPPSPLAGAGGQEVFTGPDGRPWLAYHAWVRGQVGYPNPRRLYVAHIDLDRQVPVITASPITSG
jgi:Glycosyl hydrolases family 43